MPSEEHIEKSFKDIFAEIREKQKVVRSLMKRIKKMESDCEAAKKETDQHNK